MEIGLLVEKMDSVFSCFLDDYYSFLECAGSRDETVLGKLRATLGI